MPQRLDAPVGRLEFAAQTLGVGARRLHLARGLCGHVLRSLLADLGHVAAQLIDAPARCFQLRAQPLAGRLAVGEFAGHRDFGVRRGAGDFGAQRIDALARRFQLTAQPLAIGQHFDLLTFDARQLFAAALEVLRRLPQLRDLGLPPLHHHLELLTALGNEVFDLLRRHHARVGDGIVDCRLDHVGDVVGADHPHLSLAPAL